MRYSAQKMRLLWADFAARRDRMITINFAGARLTVAKPSTDAWQALATIMERHNYVIRPGDTGAYNDRPITGGTERSLHAYGIAADVNWDTNP